jgi:hypothetical protein
LLARDICSVRHGICSHYRVLALPASPIVRYERPLAANLLLSPQASRKATQPPASAQAQALSARSSYFCITARALLLP